MTNKKIIEELNGLYDSEPSEKGRQFVRSHEQRSLQLTEIVLLELKYIGLPGVFSGIVLLILMFAAVCSSNIYFMWVFSAVLPVAGLFPIIALGRSERCGMGEMEAASRFSLHFVRMTRIMILGCFSLAVIIASSVILGSRLETGILTTLFCIAVPYLLNACGCMFVLRKWHAAENIFGCIGTGLATALIPLIAERTAMLQTISTGVLGATVVFLFAITIKESISYIKESENPSWNLC